MLTPVGMLDREKRLGVVKESADVVVGCRRNTSLRERTWVLLTSRLSAARGSARVTPNSDDDIAAAARAALAGR